MFNGCLLNVLMKEMLSPIGNRLKKLTRSLDVPRFVSILAIKKFPLSNNSTHKPKSIYSHVKVGYLSGSHFHFCLQARRK